MTIRKFANWHSKGVHDNTGHLEIGKILTLGRDCLFWPRMEKIWRLLHGKLKEHIRLLKCIWAAYFLADFLYSLFNWRGSDGKDGHASTYSPLLAFRKSIGQRILPAMYNCVKCVCIRVTIILMFQFMCNFVTITYISFDFKISWKIFSQREAVTCWNYLR